jgi:hypothetical protein
VVRVGNPRYSVGKDERIMVFSQLGQKLEKSYLKIKPGIMAMVPATADVGRRITVQGQSGKKQDPI